MRPHCTLDLARKLAALLRELLCALAGALFWVSLVFTLAVLFAVIVSALVPCGGKAAPGLQGVWQECLRSLECPEAGPSRD